MKVLLSLLSVLLCSLYVLGTEVNDGIFTSACLPLGDPLSLGANSSLITTVIFSLSNSSANAGSIQVMWNNYIGNTCGLPAFSILATGTYSLANGVVTATYTSKVLTPLYDLVTGALQAQLCTSYNWTTGVGVDINTNGCLGIGVAPSCTSYYSYNIASAPMYYFSTIDFGTSCAPPPSAVTALPYSKSSPTMPSGYYVTPCVPFSAGGEAVFNSYAVQFTATSGTTGTYSISTNTYSTATCNAAVLFGVVLLQATYTIDGPAAVANTFNWTYANPAGKVDYTYTVKTVTPANPTAAAVFSAECGGTFTANTATSILANGCSSLGILPASQCPTVYDLFQISKDGSTIYFGTPEFTACSTENRVSTLSTGLGFTKTTPPSSGTTTQPPTTAAPSASSFVSANVLVVLLLTFLALAMQF